MLQRLTEEMEYSDLLDKAAASTNSLEEMCFVAAFTISSYSTTSVRTGKPFNPLLGETFEMDRSLEEGWRCLAEQVSCDRLRNISLLPSPESFSRRQFHQKSVHHHLVNSGFELFKKWPKNLVTFGSTLLIMIFTMSSQ